MAGGGTAGHIVPGLAVAAALVDRGHDPASIRFMGSARGLDRELVPAAGFEVELYGGRGIQRRLTLANLGAALGILAGFGRAVASLIRRRPAVMLSVGGYASLAPAVAAVLLRIPIVVSEQNARASASNRLIGRFARACAVPFAGTDLPRAVVTGNPVRAAVLEAAELEPVQRRICRADAGIGPDDTVVLAFAGSLGSRRINEAVGGLLRIWQHRDDIVIHHVIGARDFDAGDVPPAPTGPLRYEAVRYEHDMATAMLRADVAVCRSGGGVAELTVMGLPAVLVPLPNAPADHQEANAEQLAAAGAAVVVDDRECTSERLAEELDHLISGGRLHDMAAAAGALGRPAAAADIAALIEQQI